MKRIALIAAFFVVLPAAGAHAATKFVFAGYDGPPGAPFGTQPEGFYPDTISVHPGDRVQWRFRGFISARWQAGVAGASGNFAERCAAATGGVLRHRQAEEFLAAAANRWN